jgi:preprotein translocase SecF subunit
MGRDFSVEEIQTVLAPYELDADIVHAGAESHEVIIKTKVNLTNDERIEIFNAAKETFGIEDSAFGQTEQFGPTIGDEIKEKALLSILLASLGMLIYVTFRFEYKFGVSAIIALMHDVLIVLAMYSIFRIPVNSSVIAAILTIVGYSINDTIVVFDRLRENIKYMNKRSHFEVADISIKQTLRRSLNTSFTTLLVIGSLYVLGVESIKEFALPLLVGVLTGTYSSIFIASPIWALWKNHESKKHRYKAA